METTTTHPENASNLNNWIKKFSDDYIIEGKHPWLLTFLIIVIPLISLCPYAHTIPVELQGKYTTLLFALIVVLLAPLQYLITGIFMHLTLIFAGIKKNRSMALSRRFAFYMGLPFAIGGLLTLFILPTESADQYFSTAPMSKILITISLSLLFALIIPTYISTAFLLRTSPYITGLSGWRIIGYLFLMTIIAFTIIFAICLAVLLIWSSHGLPV